jgi:hypothetical protein
MIVFLTSRGHGYTLKRFKPTEHAFPVPRIRRMDYDRLFRSYLLPRATYIFGDIERLTAAERKAAAHCHRALTQAGMRCLNDPAATMMRFELLNSLHVSGVNPQAVYRADEMPRPARFPVFIRQAQDHRLPNTPLLHDQDELERAIVELRSKGIATEGLLVIELCAEEYLPGRWHKWGLFRVGDRYSLDHISIDDNWLVKYGKWDLLSDEAVRDEHDAIFENRHVEALKRAFETARIEFGRADFAVVNGRVAVYEINTNPTIGRFVPDPIPLRLESQMHARRRVAEAFAAIDTPRGGYVFVSPPDSWTFPRNYRIGFLPRRRP